MPRFAAYHSQPVVLLAPTQATTLDDYLATLTNPIWNDSGQTTIMLDGVFNGQATKFLASANDTEPHGQTVYSNAMAGQYGPIANYAAPPPPTQDELNTYAANKASTLLSTSRGYPEGTVGTISCAVGLEQGNLNQLHIWGINAAASDTTQWTDDNYATFTLTAPQAVTFWNDTTAYQQSVNATLASVADGIANGTITSYAQIDAAAWPT